MHESPTPLRSPTSLTGLRPPRIFLQSLRSLRPLTSLTWLRPPTSPTPLTILRIPQVPYSFWNSRIFLLSLCMKKNIAQNDRVEVLAHGLDESEPLELRMGRNLREGSLRSLRELEESFRRLESTGIIPRGYVRYMNDMIETIKHRIKYRL